MDTIFPASFFDRLRQAHEPEKRLMAAILEDAVQVYREHATTRPGQDRDLLRDVEAWFASDEATDAFSFLRICHDLAVDPQWFRQVLARWRSYRGALRSHVARLASSERLAS